MMAQYLIVVLLMIISQGVRHLIFSLMLEKYTVRDVSGLRSPSFESSSVLHITLTYTSSMQELVMQGMKHKLERSCSRYKKEHLTC